MDLSESVVCPPASTAARSHIWEQSLTLHLARVCSAVHMCEEMTLWDCLRVHIGWSCARGRRFAQMIGTRVHAEYMWRVTKDAHQHSLISRENILE